MQNSEIVFTGFLRTNEDTFFTGANFLNLSEGTLKVGGSLTIDDVITSNNTVLELYSDTVIFRESIFTLGSVNLKGNILTLGSPTTDLIIENPSPVEGKNEGIFQMQSADLTWTGPNEISKANIYSSGGRLTLASGSSLASSGSIDLSDSSFFVLDGSFSQTGGELNTGDSRLLLGGDYSKTGGILKSSQSTVQLTDDVNISTDGNLSLIHI